MQKIGLQNIKEANFRANPHYKLIPLDRLPDDQQERLADLQQDSGFYGVLYPDTPSGATSAGLGVKSVCQDTALLFFTLQEAGKLPAYVKPVFGEQCNQAIAELVLDGVLEIEHNGNFVSGLAAYGAIYEETPPVTARSTTAQLSIEALKYAQALALEDVTALSNRLYFYNRIPLSPRWQRQFPTSAAVAEYLGLQSGGANKSLLDQNWSRVSLEPPHDGWFVWQSRHKQRRLQQTKVTYKLYISPACEFIRDAFQAALEVLSTLRTSSFKIGKDVYGLLRPDKIVAYFVSFEELAEAADHLQHKLAGCPAHGVPFTALISDNGLLSWGIDPPREEQVPIWQMPESWRLWVTNRLAVALLAATTTQSGPVEPWQFAIERLRLEGVDPATWTPTKKMWSEYTTVGER